MRFMKKMLMIGALQVIGMTLQLSAVFVNPTIQKTEGDPYAINILSYNTALLEILAQDFIEEFVAFFKGDFGDVKEDNKEEAARRDLRGKLIGAAVKPFEVVAFQEVFDRSARKALRKSLRDNGFQYSTDILGAGLRHKYKAGPGDCLKKWHLEPDKYQMGRAYDQPDGVIVLTGMSDKKIDDLWNGEQHMCVIGDLGNDGGVMIVSKPSAAMVKDGEFIYKVNRHPVSAEKAKKNPDIFANKGVVYAKIVKYPTSSAGTSTATKKQAGFKSIADMIGNAIDKTKTGIHYHIFATHLQADYRGKSEAWQEEYRAQMRKEISELAAYIKSFNIPDDEPIFVVGDMNILDKKINPSYKHLQHQYEKDLYDYMVSTLNVFVPPLEGQTFDPNHDFKQNKPQAKNANRIDYVMIVKNGAFKRLEKSFNKLYAIKSSAPWYSETDQKTKEVVKKYSLSDHPGGTYGYFKFKPSVK